MRIRIADRILVAVAGLLLIASSVALVLQLYCGVDVVGTATRVLTQDTVSRKVFLTFVAACVLALGVYCLLVLFRHRGRRDRFILQKNENGELAISLTALQNMIDKCLAPHQELDVQNVFLENQRDGLLVLIRGSVAGGISIPLTVEALQKQIKQYVTACSGVEVKSIRVQIESSGEDATDAPFAIDAPTAQTLLQEGTRQEGNRQEGIRQEEERTRRSLFREMPGEYPDPMAPAAAHAASAPPAPVAETPVPGPVKEQQTAPAVPDPVELMDEEDDRPMHQRLFSMPSEPCIVPIPPEGIPEEAETAAAPEKAGPVQVKPKKELFRETAEDMEPEEELPEDTEPEEELTEESEPDEELTEEPEPDEEPAEEGAAEETPEASGEEAPEEKKTTDATAKEQFDESAWEQLLANWIAPEAAEKAAPEAADNAHKEKPDA